MILELASLDRLLCALESFRPRMVVPLGSAKATCMLTEQRHMYLTKHSSRLAPNMSRFRIRHCHEQFRA